MKMREEEEEIGNQRRRSDKLITNPNREQLNEMTQLRIKLLFSFLEIYTIGVTSVIVANHNHPYHPYHPYHLATATATALHSFFQIREGKYFRNTHMGEMTRSSSCRLQALFRTYREFLR